MLALVLQIRFAAAGAGADVFTSSEISLYAASHLAHFVNTAPATFCLVNPVNRKIVLYKSLVRTAIAEAWYACSQISTRSSTSGSWSRSIYALARSSFDDILSTFLPLVLWAQLVRLWRRALTPRPQVSEQKQPCYFSYQLQQLTPCRTAACLVLSIAVVCAPSVAVLAFSNLFDDHINTFTHSTVLVSTSVSVTVIPFFT